MAYIKKINKNFKKIVNYIFENRVCFIFLLTFLYWFKCIYSYKYIFWFATENIIQKLDMYSNPISISLILFGLILFIRPTKLFYIISLLIYFFNTLFLYANIIYFRAFGNFISINAIVTGKSNLNGLGMAATLQQFINKADLWFFIDFVIIIILLAIKYFKLKINKTNSKITLSIILLGLLILAFNIVSSHIENPKLVSETASQSKQNEFVKYFGVDNNIIFDAYQFYNQRLDRKNASKKDLNPIIKFNKQNYAKPDPSYYGKAKHKNVIFIHLESFQQSLIGLKVHGKPVTPFLNKIYKDKSTYSFDNFYNQVGQGRTVDAENMIENGSYGLPKGSLFPEMGNKNTFQATPQILKSNGNYTSAVFHGNDGSFYNRNNTYKRLGFNYFFDSNSYNMKPDNLNGMGLKDKLLFKQSQKYVNNLQQPFYLKFITVTNHVPYILDKKDQNFKTSHTNNPSVDNYLITAHYLDESVKEFYSYLDKSGLKKNSMIIIYGDHYGIYPQDEPALASLLKVKSNKFNPSYHTELQKVPFMINIPGTTNGHVSHTYGGEIDIRPTMLNLLGIKNSQFINFGSDLFSKQHSQLVALRNRDWVTPRYTFTSGKLYSNKTHKEIKLSKNINDLIKSNQKIVNKRLNLSDKLNEDNLLRFYHPKHFKKVNPKKINYQHQYRQEINIENKLKNNSTAIK